ncbi:alanine--glyoxylate aminotransferase family protein [Bradyrhizobium sp. LHD-71]|uniref:pyridoxal-phosphate-dependent aminotransferase family protein n=1 Tax=Bradyrhizobium sp. LHD-71 TaxID=3072141 RepID=UPI00280DF39A|nr:alanine--glyoxylate aminotransferase family protein [Bradyrhizobium sp. LHD-71]MDQ8730240.1 alanine--glyoxylate aminotransferase family protein [Bradyrhizobium sp. LHD-71]
MLTIPDYRLRLPGPTAVPERVRQATALPVLNHRGAEFKAMLAECQQRLKPIFGTRHDVLLFAGSGTAMMEAAVANVVSPGDAVLIVVAGQFGDRFVSIAKALGATVDTIDVEWGGALDAQRVAERLKSRSYRAVVMVHNESSTGVAYDIAAVGAVVRDTPALLIVDSVSGLAGIEMKMDAWGADIVVSASQKSLMCAPGLGFAAVSAKAWKVIDRDGRVPSFFADFRRAKASLEKDGTPFTPPVTLVYGLLEALHMIDEEGLANVLRRHSRLAAALRAGVQALGVELYNQPDISSSTVVAMKVPRGLEGGAIVQRLRERYRTVIAGARHPSQTGKVFRIGTMGAVSETDIITDLRHLEATLKDLGKPAPTQHAGVRAALDALAASA